jgi:hypothetical protein
MNITRRGFLALVFVLLSAAGLSAADEPQFLPTKLKKLKLGDGCRVSLLAKNNQSSTYEGVVAAILPDGIEITASRVQHNHVRRWGVAILANVTYTRHGPWQELNAEAVTIKKKQVDKVWVATVQEPGEAQK